MRSTAPTAATRVRTAGRTRPTTCWCSGTTFTPQPVLNSGNCAVRRALIVSISACACWTVTPDFIRAVTSIQRPLGVRASARRPIVTHSAASRSMKKNSGGMTPTTVNALPFRVMALPTIAGSAPNRRVHRAWLRIATRVSGLSSSGRNHRPCAGVHAQDWKEIRGHRLRRELLGIAVAAGDRHPEKRGLADTCHAFEHARLLGPVDVIARRDDVVHPLAGDVLFPDDDEPVRIRIGKRLEHQRVEDREDRGVGADADGEREERRGGERPAADEATNREAEIGEEIAHVHHVHQCSFAYRAERPGRLLPDFDARILQRAGKPRIRA